LSSASETRKPRLRENLKRSPEGRILGLKQMQRFVQEARRALREEQQK
jgi:hypothetical protein